MFIFLIKEIRKEKEMTQKELAEAVGITIGYLSKIENNKVTNVSFDLIFKISEVLNVEIEKLYFPARKLQKLKEEMYELIEEKGINSPEVLKISKIIDKLVVLKMEKDGMSKNVE